jgi:BirA family biotin operon repressor/biotin-[acetyl-CoA-carboxylase] ligase
VAARPPPRALKRAGSSEAAPLVARVYGALARGGFHSGTELARLLGVSRSAIWKAAMMLRELGVVVHAVRNRGYRLPTACEALDTERIRELLTADVRGRIRRMDAAWSLASTNATLLARTDLRSGEADVLVAEYQTAGRGRRGRPWMAPPGGAICLSIGWSFPQVPRDLGALGLAVGVCVLRALRRHVTRSISLKWPNDLLVEERKLAGILIEMRAETNGPSYVVIGVGINVALGPKLLEQIAAAGTQAVDLRAAGADHTSRNAVIASLVESIVSGLLEFAHTGLRPFLDEWKRADALRGRAIDVHSGERVVSGLARGIDLAGALLVETPAGVQRFVAGEVSVRAQA